MAESIHHDRNRRRAEHFGFTDLESVPDAPSMNNTKAELLEAAAVAGVEADESMTKAQILEALEA